MSVQDFINTPEALEEHQRNTARTYLHFLCTTPHHFTAAWEQMDELTRYIVRRQLQDVGATPEELEQLG